MQADGFEVTTAASVSIDFSMSHSKYPWVPANLCEIIFLHVYFYNGK